MSQVTIKPSYGSGLQAPMDQIPYFEAVTPEGTAVNPWQFKQKNNLLALFFDSPDPVRPLLEAFSRRNDDLEWLDTKVLMFTPGAAETGNSEDPLIVLQDGDRSLAKAFGVPDSAATAILFDRFGAFYQSWRRPTAGELPVDDILKTIQLMESECPECGDRCWSGLM